MSMFDDIGMRKTQKSAIYDCFQTVILDIDKINSTFIIDGEFLLRRVVWDHEETFHNILNKYVQYRQKVLLYTYRVNYAPIILNVLSLNMSKSVRHFI